MSKLNKTNPMSEFEIVNKDGSTISVPIYKEDLSTPLNTQTALLGNLEAEINGLSGKSDFEKAFLNNLDYDKDITINTPVPEYLFCGRRNMKGNLKFTNNVTSIAHFAFKNSGFSGKLELAPIQNISQECFYGCKNFEGDVVIPDTVTSISAGAFAYFGTIGKTGELKLPESLTSLTNNNCFTNSCFTGHLRIPSAVKNIPQNCFYKTRFTSLDLNQVEKIEQSGFYQIVTLTGDLVIPDTVTSIAGWGFSSCGFKGTLTLGKSLQTLGNAAFRGCMFTGKLILPSSITKIEGYVFYTDTTFDKMIRCEAIVPPTLNSTANSLPFPPNTEGVVIEVPMASVDAYKSATNWSSYNIVGYEE